jgi:hypothetical protein
LSPEKPLTADLNRTHPVTLSITRISDFGRCQSKLICVEGCREDRSAVSHGRSIAHSLAAIASLGSQSSRHVPAPAQKDVGNREPVTTACQLAWGSGADQHRKFLI